MTEQDPRVGELWSMRDAQQREIRGVVADVGVYTITVVSFTGQRHKAAPAQFRLNWAFVRRAPQTGLSCSRLGCGLSAVFRYVRDGSPEYVCARHLPVAIVAELLDDDPALPQETGPSCPNCQKGTVTENASIPRSRKDQWCLWECLDCSTNWVYVPFIGDEESRSRLRAILEMVKRSQVDPREVWTDGTPLNVDIPTSVRVLSKAPNGFALVILEKPLRLTRVIPVQKLGALPSTEGGPQRFLLSPTYKKDPAPGSMWLHRPSGTWVQVTKRSGDAIHFRAGENAPVGVLHIDAFIDVHEPINQRDTTPVTGIEIALDEEWSDGADGVACRIVSVDQRSGVVRVAAPSGEIQSVNLIWFTNGRWKRVERRTVYERLLSDFVKED